MRIVRRIKGNKAYYYLQHSFRKEGKVVTKEQYLGKDIPKNVVEEEKRFLEACKKNSIFTLFERIQKAYEKEGKTYPASMKEKIREQLIIEFTYNTNAIEGSSISKEETQELIEHHIAPHKPLRDVKESETHATLFFEVYEKHEQPLSIAILLEWHRCLFSETKEDIAGKFRQHRIRVGLYVAPDWQDVEQLMHDLFVFYHNNKKKMHPVELAARMHYQFEKIHPFSDGNGRAGRILMNYILLQNKYPLLIIEYKKRKSYYHALQKQENDFLIYFARRYVNTHKRYLKKQKERKDLF